MLQAFSASLAMLLAAAEPLFAAIAEPAGGAVRFPAVKLATGRMLGLNQNKQFPMQSLFKLPIAIEVLHQVDADKIDLDQEIRLTNLMGSSPSNSSGAGTDKPHGCHPRSISRRTSSVT